MLKSSMRKDKWLDMKRSLLPLVAEHAMHMHTVIVLGGLPNHKLQKP